MALPALKMEWEPPVEQRLTKLESAAEHIQADTTAIKADVGYLKDAVARLDLRIEKTSAAANASIAALALSTEKSISELALSTEKSFGALALSVEKKNSSLVRWGIALYIGLIAGLATGFMWIAERLPPVQ